MTETDDPEHRTYHQPDPGRVEYRELDDESEGLFAVRMPIASSGEVRNEGDEPLTRDELGGMARQINDGDVGVFLSHGRSFEISDARFGQTERLGSWHDAGLADVERDEGEKSLLEAEARLADPDTLPEETGRFRETLAILKEQAKRDIPLSSSIGWRADESAPGGNDLLEASIVGIPADPETTTTQAVARAAVDAGADPEALVEEVRAVVMGSDADEGGNARETVTEDTDTSGEESGDTTEEQSATDDAEEFRTFMREQTEQQTEILRTLAESIREDDEDDDEDEDEDDEDDEQSADTDEEQEADGGDEQATDDVDDLRDALDTLREGGVDVEDLDLPDADGEQSETTDDDTTDTGDQYDKYGIKPV